MRYTEVIKKFEERKRMWGISFGTDQELYSVALLPETDLVYASNVLYFSYGIQVGRELPMYLIVAGDEEDIPDLRIKYGSSETNIAVVRRDRFGEVFNQTREMVEYDSLFQTQEQIYNVYHSFPKTMELALAYCVPSEQVERFPDADVFRDRLGQKVPYLYVVALRGGMLILTDWDALRDASLIYEIVPVECRVKIGVSKMIDHESRMRSAYYEAYEALNIGRIMWPEDSFYSYYEMAVFNLMKDAADRQEIDRYLSPSVEKLKNYDQQMNTHLVATLHTYLLENCSIKDTAKKLYLHRNTVIYRLNKIRQLTNLNLESARTRFILLLSYAALQVKEKFT